MPSDYIPNAITSKTCWYYNWSAWAADTSLTGNLKFVPMLWGQDKVGDFQSQVINTGTNYGIAMAMNELVVFFSASGSSYRTDPSRAPTESIKTVKPICLPHRV
jgi:hypothetical protein